MAVEVVRLVRADVRAEKPKIETASKEFKIRYTAKTEHTLKVDNTAKIDETANNRS